MTLEQFDQAMGPAIGVAANLGVKLQDVAAAETTLTQHGLDAAEAATQLKSIMEHVVNPVGVAAKTFKELQKSSGESADELKSDWQQNKQVLGEMSKITGTDLVKAFSLAGLQANGFKGTMEIVSKAVGKHHDEVMRLIPALKGGFGALILAGTGAEDLRRDFDILGQTMSGKLDPTTDGFNRTMATTHQRFEILCRQVETDLIPAGNSLMTTLYDLTPVIKDLADDGAYVLKVFSHMPHIVQECVIGFGALRVASLALGMSFGSTGKMALDLFTKLGLFKVGIAGAEGAGMSAAATFGAGGVVIVALAALGDELYHLTKYWEDMREAEDQASASAKSYAALSQHYINEGGRPAVVESKRKKQVEIDEDQDQIDNINKYSPTQHGSLPGVWDIRRKLLEDRIAALKRDIAKDDNYLTSHKDKSQEYHDTLAQLHPHKAPPQNTGSGLPDLGAHNDHDKKDKKDTSWEDEVTDYKKAYAEILVTSSRSPFGALIDGSHQAELAVKLLTGQITQGSTQQHLFGLALRGGQDESDSGDKEIDAGKKALENIEQRIRDMRAQMAGGSDQTEYAKALADKPEEEAVLPKLAVPKDATQDESKQFADLQALIDLKNAHIKTINTQIQAQHESALAAAKELDLYNTMSPILESVNKSRLSGIDAILAENGVSLTMLNQMDQANKQSALSYINETKHAEALKLVTTNSQEAMEAVKHYGDTAYNTAVQAAGGQESWKTLSPQEQQNATQQQRAIQLSQWTSKGDMFKDQQKAILELQTTMLKYKASMLGTYNDGEDALLSWEDANKEAIDAVNQSGNQAAQDALQHAQAQILALAGIKSRIEELNQFRGITGATGKSWSEFMAPNDYQKWRTENNLTDKSPISKQDQKSAYNSQRTLATVKQLATGTEEVITNALEGAYSKGTKGLFTNLETGFRKTLYNWGVQYITSDLYQHMNSIFGNAAGGKNAISQMAGLGKGSQDAAQAELNAASKEFSEATTEFKMAVAKLVAGVSGTSPSKVSGGASAINGVSQIVTGIPGLTSGGSSAINSVSQIIKGIPGLASGGIFGGGSPILVGEKGPELIVPHSGGAVLNNDDTKDALSGRSGRGGNTHIHMNITTKDAQSFHKSSNQIIADLNRHLAIAKKRGIIR
jgi:hypothetical protein